MFRWSVNIPSVLSCSCDSEEYFLFLGFNNLKSRRQQHKWNVGVWLPEQEWSSSSSYLYGNLLKEEYSTVCACVGQTREKTICVRNERVTQLDKNKTK